MANTILFDPAGVVTFGYSIFYKHKTPLESIYDDNPEGIKC